MALGERLLDRIERASVLDRAAELTARAAQAVIPKGIVEDTLTGKELGHPAHPALVAVPIGAWTVTNYFDLTGDHVAARRAQALGVLAALPAAATGAADWATTSGAERRVGFVHAGLNDLALMLHWWSWSRRRSGHDRSAMTLALAGSAVVALSGWIGGHLAYALGVGVDTTAFQKMPTDWVDAVAEDDVPAIGVYSAEVAEIPMFFARYEGRIVAYADRCTHRGAPLHEGSVQSGCITCAWHGSVFSLADGSVRSGPATRPQPRLEVEVRDGRVRVRRDEERTLRTNPVGR